MWSTGWGAARMQGVEDTRRRMLSDLAHELRTPIATLSAYHEGLHDGVVTLGDDSRMALTAQTERLARLAEDINEVSTAEEGHLVLDIQRHKVADLLWAAYGDMRDSYSEKGINLVLDVDQATGLETLVDPVRFAQVMTNLLSNALRHTPAGGTITLAAGREGGEAIITVTDTGEGMTPDQVQHAFERFYRGDSARTNDRRGSGIGLTISKAIIDAHHGDLTASSPGPRRGSCFTISLPLVR